MQVIRETVELVDAQTVEEVEYRARAASEAIEDLKLTKLLELERKAHDALDDAGAAVAREAALDALGSGCQFEPPPRPRRPIRDQPQA